MKEPVEKKTVVKEEAVEINDKQIQAWKKKWGKIYKTTVGGEDFIWRKLKRREYVNIMAMGAILEDDEEDEEVIGNRVYRRQESIAKAVVIFPANIEEIIEDNAGLATSISDEVILKSGFDVAATEEL